MRTLNNLIIRWSRSWWPLLVSAVASLLSFRLLQAIGERFAVVTGGYPPFDLQNPLDLADILAQLPFYGASSRALYWIFIVADMIFPMVGALPLVLLLAKVLRSVGRAWSTSGLQRGLALTPLLGAILDWIENGFFVVTVALYPQDITAWGTLAIAMKITKISLLIGCNVAITGLALYAGLRWLTRPGVRTTSIDKPQPSEYDAN